jgi:hypothetical protein
MAPDAAPGVIGAIGGFVAVSLEHAHNQSAARLARDSGAKSFVDRTMSDMRTSRRCSRKDAVHRVEPPRHDRMRSTSTVGAIRRIGAKYWFSSARSTVLARCRDPAFTLPGRSERGRAQYADASRVFAAPTKVGLVLTAFVDGGSGAERGWDFHPAAYSGGRLWLPRCMQTFYECGDTTSALASPECRWSVFGSATQPSASAR